jgi:hypothetical protein
VDEENRPGTTGSVASERGGSAMDVFLRGLTSALKARSKRALRSGVDVPPVVDDDDIGFLGEGKNAPDIGGTE